jgi:Creatinase/Prolidase N-terminal domain
MRRGLMGWNEADLPLAALKQRLSRLQAGLKREGLGGLIVYTNIARPAAATFLSGFTPYWSEGLLFVPAAGEPIFATALSKRVAEWIRSVMPIGAIENTPQPAAAIRRKLTEAAVDRVGVLELDLLPTAQAGALAGDDNAIVLEDATALFRSIRLHVDDAEINLVRRADVLARDCLEAIDGSSDARRLVAGIEARARLAGAEEVFVGVNPDLARPSAFLHSDRLDGALGAQFVVRLSLSLKGAWVRRAITWTRMPEQQSAFTAADQSFQHALTLGSAAKALKALQNSFPGKITAWTVEACIGSYPLETIARFGENPLSSDIPLVSVVSVQAEMGRTVWCGAGPIIGQAQSL